MALLLINLVDARTPANTPRSTDIAPVAAASLEVSGIKDSAATDAASMPTATDKPINVPILTFLANLVTAIKALNIRPIPAIAPIALVMPLPSIMLNAAIDAVISSIDAENDSIKSPILPALNEYLPIKLVAAISPMTMPENAAITRVPLASALVSILPSILTDNAISNSPALIDSIIFPNLVEFSDIEEVIPIATIIKPTNVTTASPPLIKVLVSIEPKMYTTPASISREKLMFLIILPKAFEFPEISLVMTIIPDMIIRNAVMARPPCINVLVSIEPNM